MGFDRDKSHAAKTKMKSRQVFANHTHRIGVDAVVLIQHPRRIIAGVRDFPWRAVKIQHLI